MKKLILFLTILITLGTSGVFADEFNDRSSIGGLYVSLEKYFEKLWVERERNVSLQFNAVTERLDATAKVLEHRLEVLNHAHEQSVQDRISFLNSNEFKNFKLEYEKWQTSVNTAITTFNTRYEFRITMATVISIASMLLGISSFILMVMRIKKV